MDRFIRFKNFWLCSVHGQIYGTNSSCPKCSSGNEGSNISIGNEGFNPRTPQEKQTPSFPLENSKISKKVMSRKENTISRLAHGKERLVPNRNGSKIFERFHSFRRKFNAIIDFDNIPAKEVHLKNNVVFKKLDFDCATVQVFRKSILIILRSTEEIKGLPVKDALVRSELLVSSIVSRLPSEIVVSDSKLVEVHNAFVNHPFAEKKVSVSINGQKRFISDNSKGNPEFEAVNPEFVVSDSGAIEEDLVSLIDKGLSRDFLASAINSLIDDRKYYADNLRSHVEAIRKLGDSVDRLNTLSLNNSGGVNRHISPPTFSKDDVINKSKEYRLFKARQLLKKFGWGGSIWD